ncbi:MAG: hypothetical protein M3O70_24680 [Actinomycetota bacterium]|nr:hypothetical protein [Actinomycetota bacterium]
MSRTVVGDSARTTYFVVSWTDHQRRDRASAPRTREYGTVSSKQAAIRLAEKLLPPDAEYVVTTLHRTVHHGRTLRTEPPPTNRTR